MGPEPRSPAAGNTVFHRVENFFAVFPHYGKIFSDFSTLWKKFRRIFHSMEKIFGFFPRYGKNNRKISTAWKILFATLQGLTPILVVAGCAGVKAGRLSIPAREHWRASASGHEGDDRPELALDGKTNTWWRSGTEEPQWLEVDLGRAGMVCGFSLQWAQPHAKAYALLTSLDGTHWAMGYETASGDGDWDQVSIDPLLGRYVRVVVNEGLQGTGAALASVEIQGLADQPAVRVNGVADPQAAALLDGDPGTAWRSPRSTAEVEVDLRRAKPVGSVRVDWGTNSFASNVVVEVSTNREEWSVVGVIQARQGGEFDVAMGEVVRPARWVRLAFSEASAADGFEVAGITLRGAEGAARPWAMYELAASRAPEGVYPEAFRRRQSFWAAMVGPQPGDPESLLDEWGGFAPRARGPTLAPLIVAEGQVLSAHQAQRVEHRLGGDGAPILETDWHLASGLSLRIRAMARPKSVPPMAWVQYELANDSLMTQTGRLCWVVRPVRLPPPWAGGGLVPLFKIRRVELSGGWQEIWGNDARLFAMFDGTVPFGSAPFRDGDVTEFFLRGEAPEAQEAWDEDGLASAAWWRDYALEPGEKLRVVVAGNPQDVAGSTARRYRWPEAEAGAEKMVEAFDREWVEAVWAWRGETGRYAPKIDRPEAIECLHAQVAWLMGVRGLAGGGEGEELATMAARVPALLRAGQPAAAKEWIERAAAGMFTNGWVPAVYRLSGAAAPRMGQEGRHATQGQFAFMVMEYYRFTQDIAFLKHWYPAVRSALGYLQGLRAELEKTEWKLPAEERELVEGLLPLSGPRPGSPRPVHLYADHYWALLGWKEGRAAASVLGLDEDAAWADEQYRLLKSAVRRSLRFHLDRRDSCWLPASAEEERFDAGSVALLFWPCEETDLVDPHELQSSLDRFYEDFLLRQEAGGTGRLPSDEAQMLVPLASMARGDYAREVLYALLDRRYPAGWHVWADSVGIDPRQPGQAGFMPDLRAAAAYVTGVRGLAARETGGRLDLFSGAPAEWLQHGEGYQVYGMPTAFGPLDLHGFWKQNQMIVEIGAGARPPEGYRIWWPRQIAPERVLANGSHVRDFDAEGANLPHDFTGRVEVTFPFMAPWPRDP